MNDAAAAPQAENGLLYLGKLDQVSEGYLRGRWPFARLEPIVGVLRGPDGQQGPPTPIAVRVDLSGAPRGRPGFDDAEGLALLSLLPPGAGVVGFFCDAKAGAEGVRVFSEGRVQQEEAIAWSRAPGPDPVAWPLGRLSMQLRLPLEVLTRVPRPPRPKIAIAVEGLLSGDPVEPAELRHQALEVLGEVAVAESTAALIKALASHDWVDRFHAARGYARRARQQGTEGRPPLESLLQDEDESVREAALQGVAELIADVAFSDRELQRQIDAAIARGASDADEDVRAAAEVARERRRELLG